MAFDFHNFPTRPASVLPENNYLYRVLNTVIVIVIIGHALMIPFYFFSGYANLSIFSAANVLIWAFIWNLNQQGKHLQTTVIICIAIYLAAVIQILYLGWDAGLQYHLVAEMALLLLYPNKNLKISVVFSALILVSFLILYFLNLNVENPQTAFIIQLHTYNAVISMLALAATTLFFRTNTVKLINRLQVTANTDPLTGLINRRRMNIELDRHSKMVERYEQSNSLILLDIDFFKKVNDKHGHSGGDAILKQFSKLLNESLRDTDIIARWGGEEFLILTPFTDVKNATIAAEKLRKNVEDHSFTAAGQKVHITITCGVADLQPTKPFEDALKQADKMLYEGKDSGRNRVMVQNQ